MTRLLRHPGVLRLLAANVGARLPLAAVDVVLIIHVHALRGSWAVAGLIGGLHGLSTAVGGVALGATVDRRGQTAVLVAAGLVSGAALSGLALLPHAVGLTPLAGLAVVAGLAQPPLGACLRALWPSLLGDDPGLLPSAYALESALLELTFIAGPPAFLALAAASSALALAVIGAALAGGAVLFAADPVSRAWRPQADPGRRRARGGALRSPGVLTLTVLIGLLGILLGAVEVAVAAVASPGVVGPLLALWGLGSLLGGLAAARSARPLGPRELPWLLLGLAAGHAMLAVSQSPFALGLLLLVAGLGVAPLFGAANALAAQVALPGTSTEAFSWLTTAVAGGVALGALVGGALADGAGPAPAFAVAGAAAVLGAALAAARAGSLRVPACVT